MGSKGRMTQKGTAMFFRKSDNRECLYNKEFPWLWSLCSDWMGIGIKVSNFEDKIFDYWLSGSQLDGDRGICYFHTKQAVIKIQLEAFGQPTIMDACRRFYATHSPLEVLHIAVKVKGEGIRVYRPTKGAAIDDLYCERLRALAF